MYSDGADLDYENIAGIATPGGQPNLTSFTISTNSVEKFVANGTKVLVYKR